MFYLPSSLLLAGCSRPASVPSFSQWAIVNHLSTSASERKHLDSGCLKTYWLWRKQQRIGKPCWEGDKKPVGLLVFFFIMLKVPHSLYPFFLVGLRKYNQARTRRNCLHVWGTPGKTVSRLYVIYWTAFLKASDFNPSSILIWKKWLSAL